MRPEKITAPNFWSFGYRWTFLNDVPENSMKMEKYISKDIEIQEYEPKTIVIPNEN